MSFVDFKIIHYNSIDSYKEELNSAGVYAWFYNPLPLKFENDKFIVSDYSYDLISKAIADYCKCKLEVPSNFQTFKVKVRASSPDLNLGNRFFSLDEDKEQRLIEILKNESKRVHFTNFLNELFFSRPFYIGKTINFNKRFKDHIADDSKIMKAMSEGKYSTLNLFVGYQTIDLQIYEDEKVCELVEEIIQRIYQPTLTGRVG